MSLTVKKCIQAWTNSLKQMNAKVDVVFFGDSLTYYGDFASAFPDNVVCNLGLRGDTLQGMIKRVGQVSVLSPKIVYLMAGINDVSFSNVDVFCRRYNALVTALIEKVVGAKIIIQNLLPVNNEFFFISCNNEQIVKCNKVISLIAEKHDLCILDLYSLYDRDGVLPKEETVDGMHLHQVAYCKWINLLKNNLNTIHSTYSLTKKDNSSCF